MKKIIYSSMHTIQSYGLEIIISILFTLYLCKIVLLFRFATYNNASKSRNPSIFKAIGEMKQINFLILPLIPSRYSPFLQSRCLLKLSNYMIPPFKRIQSFFKQVIFVKCITEDVNQIPQSRHLSRPHPLYPPCLLVGMR